jgi:hypothetical protein
VSPHTLPDPTVVCNAVIGSGGSPIGGIRCDQPEGHAGPHDAWIAPGIRESGIVPELRPPDDVLQRAAEGDPAFTDTRVADVRLAPRPADAGPMRVFTVPELPPHEHRAPRRSFDETLHAAALAAAGREHGPNGPWARKLADAVTVCGDRVTLEGGVEHRCTQTPGHDVADQTPHTDSTISWVHNGLVVEYREGDPDDPDELEAFLDEAWPPPRTRAAAIGHGAWTLLQMAIVGAATGLAFAAGAVAMHDRPGLAWAAVISAGSVIVGDLVAVRVVVPLWCRWSERCDR